MAVLTPNKPLSSASATLLVENKLLPGVALFALAVVDSAGRVSAPAQLRVVVAQPSTRGTLRLPDGPSVSGGLRLHT